MEFDLEEAGRIRILIVEEIGSEEIEVSRKMINRLLADED